MGQQTTPIKSQPKWFGPFRALRHTNYRWYWISGLGLSAGQGIKQLALAWLVLDLTGSVAQLGIVVFMQGLPTAAIAMFGGVLADRYDRRQLLVYTQLVTTAALAVIALLSHSEIIMLWHIYAASVLLGITQALTMPARQAYIRSLVPREDTMNAVSLNAIQMHSARIIWPSIGGVLISTIGVGLTLAVNAAFFLIGIAGLFFIRGVPRTASVTKFSPINELVEGLRFTISTITVRYILILGVATGIFGMTFMHMTPGFARNELGFNAAETGFMMMAIGVGGMLGSIVLMSVDVKEKTRLFVRLGILLSVSLVALSLNTSYYGSFIIMGIVGMIAFTHVIIAHTLFQLMVPSQYLGRVVSLWGVNGGLISVFSLPIGILGEYIGLRWAFALPAVLLIPITIWLGLVKSPLKHMPPEAPEEEPRIS